MKKFFRLFSVFILSIAIFGLTKSVKANSINKISMDIYVNNNGDATVLEVWNCDATQGTEIYHPYYNLGNSTIKNLSVSENNKTYQTLSSWSTSSSLENKAYKCGINKVSNGVELCWGISEYGSHTYTVKYNITDFVANLTDSQMIYWTLIPKDFSNPIGSVYIKIHSNFNIEDSVDVWGYGNYGGTAYVYDGYIEMQSDGRLDTNEYMTILVKFPKGTFNSSNSLKHDFEYYFNMAEKGAKKYAKKSGSDFGDSFVGALSIIGLLVALFFTVLFTILSVMRSEGESKLTIKKDSAISNREIEYFRDIPCNGDIFRAYYIGYSYKLLKNRTDILGALLLKWLKDSLITIGKKDVGSLVKRDSDVIVVNRGKLDSITDENEQRLFKMISDASGDGVLEKKEFENWCDSNYDMIFGWFKDVMDDERYKLESEGLINVVDTKYLKFYIVTTHEATPALKQEALELAGLKKFLKDYSLIASREPIEVNLFEDYLIFAQLMGIAKDVAKNFMDIYPEIIEQSHFDNYNNIDFINYSMSHSYSSAQSTESRANSYSSGGGGFSSRGGGGGSFGGGGGGGGFR